MCELDIIFNFHKVRMGHGARRVGGSAVCQGRALTRNFPAPSPPHHALLQAYYILDELLLAGHLQEANKREVLHVTAVQDELMDESKEGQGKRR